MRKRSSLPAQYGLSQGGQAARRVAGVEWGLQLIVTTAPAPATYDPPTAAPEAPAGGPRWRRLGCLGCLSVGGLLSCCLVAILIFGAGLWRRLGIFGPTAEELYSGAPDPFASRVLNQMLSDIGLTGASALVIPIQESEGQIAVISLDPEQGFDGTGSAAGNEQMFMSVIQRMREDNRMQMLGLERVAVDYRDESGQSLVTLTAAQSAVEALAQGEITQDEFLKEVEIGVAGLGLREALRLATESSSSMRPRWLLAFAWLLIQEVG